MQRLMAGACLLFVAVLAGCTDTASVSQETKTSTPGGTTTTTVEKRVDQSGSNPPPATTP